MPSPSSALVTLRPDLSASFMQFDLAMSQRGFIAQRVFPVIDVAKASGNFGIIPLDQLLQHPDTTRAPGSGYSRGRFTFTPSTYATQEHGHEEPVDDAEAELYSSYFDAEQIGGLRAYDAVLRGMEVRTQAVAQSTATFTGAKTGAAATTYLAANWASATPINDFETGIQAVWNNSGLWPNAAIMSRKTFRNLRQCQQIVDRIKYSGIVDPRAGKITPQALAEVFDIEEVIVGGEAKNTADEGQTATPASIWTDQYILIARIARTIDPREPCVGRIFNYDADGGSIGGTVEAYRDEPKRSEIVRVRNQTDEHLLYSAAGYLLTGCA
jgi:hypothetical protein